MGGVDGRPHRLSDQSGSASLGGPRCAPTLQLGRHLMGDSSGGGAPAMSAWRVTSMDQFRGLTILLMFAVHYAGGFAWGVNFRPLFGHNHYYLSVGDLAFPWFHLAAGFALRLSLLRRLEALGPRAAYGRAVRRCLLLVLLAD